MIKRKLEMSKEDEYVANFGTISSVTQLSLPKRVSHTYINGLKVDLGMVWELEEYSIVYFCSLLNYKFIDERIKSKKLHLDIARIAYHEFRNNSIYDIDWSDLYSIQSSHKTTDNPFVSFATYFCVDKGRTEKEILKEITPLLESINKKFAEQQSSIITVGNNVIKTHQNGHFGLRSVDYENKIEKISELIIKGYKKREIIELLGLTLKEYNNIYEYLRRNGREFPKFDGLLKIFKSTVQVEKKALFQYYNYYLTDDIVDTVNELREKKYTIKQISAETNMSMSKVYAAMMYVKNGRVKQPMKVDIVELQKKRVEDYMKQGISVNEMAKREDLGAARIYQITKEINNKYFIKKRRDKVKLYKLYISEGLTQKQIAEKEGVTYKSVSMFIYQNIGSGKKITYAHRKKNDKIKRITNYLNEGLTLKQIAEKEKISVGGVRLFVVRNRIE